MLLYNIASQPAITPSIHPKHYSYRNNASPPETLIELGEFLLILLSLMALFNLFLFFSTSRALDLELRERTRDVERLEGIVGGLRAEVGKLHGWRRYLDGVGERLDVRVRRVEREVKAWEECDCDGYEGEKGECDGGDGGEGDEYDLENEEDSENGSTTFSLAKTRCGSSDI